MKNNLVTSILMTVVTTLLLGLAYPLIITGVAQVAFPDNANGQLIRRDGQLIGSRIIGQSFTGPGYFHSRPSAAGDGYDAANSNGSNLGPTNQKLIDRVNADTARLQAENPNAAVPVDLVTTSASGLDPDITPAAALFQVARGARERKMDGDRLQQLVLKHVRGRQFSVFGEPSVAGRRLFGIIHAAWPGFLQGGLLSVPRQALEQQLSFAVYRTIELARLLADRGENEGAHLIVLGSTAGSQKPTLNTAAYSLAKASLEHTVKLLAPELALKKIAINAICPSFLSVGMNVQANERQRLTAKAAVPLGRLCETADVLGAVRFLFSQDASFLTGQTIVLSGGQL